VVVTAGSEDAHYFVLRCGDSAARKAGFEAAAVELDLVQSVADVTAVDVRVAAASAVAVVVAIVVVANVAAAIVNAAIVAAAADAAAIVAAAADADESYAVEAAYEASLVGCAPVKSARESVRLIAVVNAEPDAIQTEHAAHQRNCVARPWRQNVCFACARVRR